jgi:hypothetical protein
MNSHIRLTVCPSRCLPASLTNLAPSVTLSSFIRPLSTWWSVHGTHAPPPVIDVPLSPGRLVCSFYCLVVIEISYVLQRVAVADAPNNDDDLVSAEYFDIHRTPIQHNQPPQCLSIPESIVVAGCVSACRYRSFEDRCH